MKIVISDSLTVNHHSDSQVKIGVVCPIELREICGKGLLLVTITVPEMEVHLLFPLYTFKQLLFLLIHCHTQIIGDIAFLFLYSHNDVIFSISNSVLSPSYI